MYLPALVTEVALDLTAHARQGVARQAGASRGIVVVDRLDEADVADLEQILVRFRAVLEPADARPHQRTVPIDEDLACRFPDRVLTGPRMDQVEQFSVIALLQLAVGQLIDGIPLAARRRSGHCRSPPAYQVACTVHLCPPRGFQTSQSTQRQKTHYQSGRIRGRSCVR